ncbi:hypothetical protein [Olleya sp. AS48]|uniref:hypothetical protein n=1 Tax=Olleya sp. AS48 TaxID=3135774 RepID=UPI00317655F0
MFEFKHEIELKTSEKTKLFGQDYFGDKSTFWNSHQTSLNSLYKKVIETGFPISITDLQFEKTIAIENIGEFHRWLKSNQPFNLDKLNG